MKGLILNSDLIRPQETNPLSDYKTTNKNNSNEKLQFYGLLENGKSFVWEIFDPKQIGFLAKNKSNNKLTKDNRINKIISDKFEDFRKNPLDCYYFSGYRTLNEYALQNSLDFQENDIFATSQYLMNHGITGLVGFKDEPSTQGNTSYYYNSKVSNFKLFGRNVENNLNAIRYFFNQDLPIFPLKVISLDIEAGMKDNLLYSIALYGLNYKKVLMMSSNKRKNIGMIDYFTSEKELLKFFLEEIKRINPHIFIGWYVVNFDFNFLVKKFNEYNLAFNLGINNLPVVSFKTEKSKEMLIKIPGRVVLEGIGMVKKLYAQLPNYKLNTASNIILGEKKIIEYHDLRKVEEIDRMFREDKPQLAEYNLQDTKLVYDLFEKLDGIRFSVIRSLLSGCQIEKIEIPNEVLDHYYLPILHKKKIAAYNPTRIKIKPNNDIGNNEFKRELYQDVFLVRLRDLYPFVILSYRIDPLGMVRAQIDRQNTLSTARGYAFHKKEHILPQLIYDLALSINYHEIKKSSSELNKLLQKVWDTEINQIVTSISSTNSRFFLPGLAEAISENVQFVMESLSHQIENLPNTKVIYFDNEAILVQYKTKKDFNYMANPILDKVSLKQKEIQEKILNKITVSFFQKVLTLGKLDHEIFPSILSVEYYPKFFLQSVSGRLKQKSLIEFQALTTNNQIITQGSKKKSIPQVNIFIDKLMEQILKAGDLDIFIKNFKKSLYEGLFDNKLIYRKRLTKNLNEYTTNLPPQAIAAKKMTNNLAEKKKIGFNSSIISYYQTIKGPEPIDNLKNKIDYQYYIDKDFFPALEKLLVNTQFQFLVDTFKSNDFQLSLF